MSLDRRAAVRIFSCLNFEDSTVGFVIELDTGALLHILQETDGAVRALTTTLEEKHHGHFMLFWTADFHGEGCGGRCVDLKTERGNDGGTR